MPHLNSLSFSVFYTLPNKKELETLDLIAKHPDDFFVWTVGLKHAIDNGGIGMDSETSEWQVRICAIPLVTTRILTPPPPTPPRTALRAANL